MSEWWTYRPEDFLLFSERVYWRLFELANAALWPWPVAAFLLGAMIAALVLLRPRGSDRLIATILAAAWLVVAWAFLWLQYRTINWAIAYAVPLFVLQAALLVVIGGVRNALTFEATRNAGTMLGLALFVYALVLHPFVALLAGRPFQAAEIFAVAPDPTVFATLGLIAAARAGPVRWLLAPIPVLWCALSWATLETMGSLEAWIPLTAIIWAFAALVLNRGDHTPPRPHA